MRRQPLYVLTAIALLAVSVHATTRSSAAVDRAPPEPIYEVEPPQRPGFVWSPGVWTWDGKRMIWASGHWLKERPGYSWVPDGWEQRADKWYYAKGYWEAKPGTQEEAVVQPPPAPEPAEEATEETLRDAPAPVKTKAPTPANGKAKKRLVKPHPYSGPNYSDQRIWPRVTQH